MPKKIICVGEVTWTICNIKTWRASTSNKYLVLVLVISQLGMYLEKGFEIKDKPVMFRCLEKGEEKSDMSDEGTSIS